MTHPHLEGLIRKWKDRAETAKSRGELATFHIAHAYARELEAALAALPGEAAPVACVHPDTLALMRETPRKWKRIGVEPPCELRTLEGYVNLYDHAPAKAREERAFAMGWRTAANWMERDDLIADIGSPAYIKDRDAALATFTEEEEE